MTTNVLMPTDANNSLLSRSWFLYLQVTLENCITEDRLLFAFGGRMFSREAEDHEICREVPLIFAGEEAPPVVHYEVRVWTGDVADAETAGHVYACLVGEHGDSGRRILYNKSTPVLFNRGQVRH